MVQEFHVLRCFSCQSFQVQQVKKVNRWSCKLCGEKQSLLKEFGRGSGADCRRHVQKLNAMRGEMMEQEHNTWNEVEPEEGEQRDNQQVTRAQVSCWSKYLSTPEEAEPEEEEGNVFTDRQQLHGNHMIDRKRKRSRGASSCTPEQSNWSSQTRTSPPTQTRTSAPGQTRTSPPTQTRTSAPGQTRTSPPTQTRTSAPGQTRTSPPTQTRTSAPGQTRTSPPTQTRTSAPGQTRTSPPTQTRTSAPGQTRTSPPSTRLSPPTGSSGPGSRWARFLRADSQMTEGEELPNSQSQLVVTSPSCDDIICQTRHRPPLPVSSMFQSEEEFSFDEDFLTN